MVGEQSASVCVRGYWDETLTVEIPVPSDELERVAAACDVLGLGVPGRLLLADGEDSSRPSARGWFGKETIQTSSFLLWMSAAERRGLCSRRAASTCPMWAWSAVSVLRVKGEREVGDPLADLTAFTMADRRVRQTDLSLLGAQQRPGYGCGCSAEVKLPRMEVAPLG